MLDKRGLILNKQIMSQEQRSRLAEGFLFKNLETFLNLLKMRHSDCQNLYALLTLAVLTLSSCASIQRPSGGPKDVEPPILLNANPENLTTNFASKKIRLRFNEYIKLQDEFREITFSPEIENFPDIKNLGKELEITFSDTLANNTTYTINFGEAIRDVNEGNKLINFTYVFSTGAELDSLSLSGKVTNAYSLLKEKDILVFAIPSGDSVQLGNKKPTIFTKTDTAGNYSLKNLRENTYSIFALADKNNDRLYQQGTETVGFYKDIIDLNENKTNVDIQIFDEQAKQFRVIDRKIEPDGTIFFTFNKPLNDPQITITEPAALNQRKIVQFSENNDSLKVWTENHQFDSIKIALYDEQNLLQNITLTRSKNETYNSTLQPKFNLENNNQLNPFRILELQFNTPLTSIDASKITLKEDSVLKTNFKIYIDSINTMLVKFEYPWREVNYELNIPDGAIKSLYGFSNKSIFRQIGKYNLKNYGKLDINFKYPDSAVFPVIAEILNDKSQVFQRNIISKDTTVIYNNFPIGKYFFRIVYDQNENGKWDAGDLELKREAEKVWIDPRFFTIRTNWELKETIKIPLN